MGTNYIIDLDAPAQYSEIEDALEEKEKVIAKLEKLHKKRNRTVYVHIILETEGKSQVLSGIATSGSILIDGTSALRRTCNLSCTLQDTKILDFRNWAYNSKIQLWTGIGANGEVFDIDEYGFIKKDSNFFASPEDIVWINQGKYLINTFSAQQTTNNLSISLSARDLMAQLNGDAGGTYIVEEVLNKYEDSNGIEQEFILRDVIERIVKTFYPNTKIYISIPEKGKKLLKYLGDNPLYILRQKNSPEIQACTIFGDQTVYYKGREDTYYAIDLKSVPLSADVYLRDPRLKTVDNYTGPFSITCLEYGQEAGYQETDLFYPKDLKASIGDTAVTMLDKIKALFVNYEYYFDTNGVFVFKEKDSQSKKTPGFLFDGADLLTSISLNAKLDNFKNDFVIWGKKNSGASILTHWVYDEKPTEYTTIRNGESITYSSAQSPWQELIYQMALDDAAGITNDDIQKYRVYFPEIKQFWRRLYDPNPQTYEKEVDFTYEPDSSWGESDLYRYDLEPLKDSEFADYSYLNKNCYMRMSETDEGEVYLVPWRNGWPLFSCWNSDKNEMFFCKINQLYVGDSLLIEYLGIERLKGLYFKNGNSYISLLEDIRTRSHKDQKLHKFCQQLIIPGEGAVLKEEIVNTYTDLDKVFKQKDFFGLIGVLEQGKDELIYYQWNQVPLSGVIHYVVLRPNTEDYSDGSYYDEHIFKVGQGAYLLNPLFVDLDKTIDCLVQKVSTNEYVSVFDRYIEQIRNMDDLELALETEEPDKKIYTPYWGAVFEWKMQYSLIDYNLWFPTNKTLITDNNHCPYFSIAKTDWRARFLRDRKGEVITENVPYKYVVDVKDYDESNGYSYIHNNTPQEDIYELEFLKSNYNVREAGRRVKNYSGEEITAITEPKSLELNLNGLSPSAQALFGLSTQGKNGQDAGQEMIDSFGPDIISLSLNTIPLYYLTPNKRITLTNIEGHNKEKTIPFSGIYTLEKITIPLTYNGTSSLTLATKILDPYVSFDTLYNAPGKVEGETWMLTTKEAEVIDTTILEVK